jgi:protein TonB
MKTLLITVALFAACSLAKAQQPLSSVEVQVDSNRIFLTVEKAPGFPGGQEGFIHFLIKTVRYPASGVENRIQGRVWLTFVVEKDGSLTDIKIAKGVSKDIDAEAVRVMKASPKWAPGMQNGKPVRVMYPMPVNFDLPKNE